MAASPLGTAVVRFGGPRSVRDTRGPHRYRFLDTRSATAGPGSSVMGARRPPTAGERPPGPLAERLARAGVRCVQVPAPVTTRPFIARAHALGLQVHVWTVNDRPTMESLLDLGVDGIMTDETVALRDVLTGRGQWHPRTVG
jgi:glycerophosphoryl diester phosphodiesterase